MISVRVFSAAFQVNIPCEEMEGVAELRVPLIADASVGETWAEAK